MNYSIFNRRGEGSSSVVAIVAILIIVLIAVWLIFFRGGNSGTETTSTPSADVNVTLPDTGTTDLGTETEPGSR